MTDIPRISDFDVAGKRLLVRADLNVPTDGDTITDATRITRFAAGMRPLLQRGARLVILTHFGRPTAGDTSGEFSVDMLRPALSEALGVPVAFAETSNTAAALRQSNDLQDGEVLLCENLRLNAGETSNDFGYATALARLGDIYVNDAFSCAHRAHASTEALAHLLPAAAGPLMIEEIDALSTALDAPKRPSVAIIGGAKVSSKIAVLKNLVQKLDGIIIGGGMANTFLFANGAPMGTSLYEADQVETVAEIKALAAKSGCALHLPKDVIVAREFRAGARARVIDAYACPDDCMILDAGPQALAAFQNVLTDAETVLWNGPLGAFEVPPFDQSTVLLARSAADLAREGLATCVAGGGDTVAALNMAGVADDFTYVSSAGGAFLEWLEGKTLPGIAALSGPAKAA
ncbi:MAG: phosphoglycerate kinase [Rhodobacteraceae bacterium]|nr:MAG: phosphoglycerate kinase [Paracoccaceae bacterium]